MILASEKIKILLVIKRSNKKKFSFVIHFVLFFITQLSYSQPKENTVYTELNVYKVNESTTFIVNAEEKSISGNAYQLMSLRNYLGANNLLIKKTGSNDLINQQKMIIDNLIKSSRVSKTIKNNLSPYKDKYKSWIVKSANYKNKNTINKEIPLFESYSFFYIAEFLDYIKESDWIRKSQENKDWWNNTLFFIENNVWTKWYERSRKINSNGYEYFLRSRTHMGSHWAGIALYLKGLTKDENIKKQANILLNQYNMLLKRNLKENKKIKAYYWNSTYDDVSETYAISSVQPKIQDVSHANHVVAYIIAAYEMGDNNWTIEDIQKLSNTFKKVLYNPNYNTFYDNLDGTENNERPGSGNFVADGWAKLGVYDKDVEKILKKFVQTEMIPRYSQIEQFKAVLFILNEN